MTFIFRDHELEIADFQDCGIGEITLAMQHMAKKAYNFYPIEGDKMKLLNILHEMIDEIPEIIPSLVPA